MIRKLTALSLAFAIGAIPLLAQDTIDPKTGKKRGAMEVLRDRDRAGKTSSPNPASPNANPDPRVNTRVHDRDHDRDRDRDHVRDRDHDRERIRHRDRDRDDDDRNSFRGDHRPPGWSKGKKTGWGDCDVPPGQV